MKLTDEQKAAGREFLAFWQQLLSQLNADFPVTTTKCAPYINWYRHPCPGRGSWALFLHQNYAPSADGLFVFYYRNGRCRCGFSVRTEGAFDFKDNVPMEKGAVLHAPYELSAVRAD